mgnify:CR=1 FL=1
MCGRPRKDKYMTKVSQLLAKNNNGNKHENEQGVCSGPNDDKYSAGGMGKKDVNMTKLLAKIQGTDKQEQEQGLRGCPKKDKYVAEGKEV